MAESSGPRPEREKDIWSWRLSFTPEDALLLWLRYERVKSYELAAEYRSILAILTLIDAMEGAVEQAELLSPRFDQIKFDEAVHGKFLELLDHHEVEIITLWSSDMYLDALTDLRLYLIRDEGGLD